MTNHTEPAVPPAATAGQVGQAAQATTAAPVVEMRDISISFPGVKALDGVDFRLFPGEVHALMGENGAGKSTLIKALTGVYGIDAGTIMLARRARVVQRSGRRAGGRHLDRLPGGQPAARTSRSPRTSCSAASPAGSARSTGAPCGAAPQQLLAGLNLDIDPGSLLGDHSLAVQQLVAIARAIDVEAKVLILDEPTSSLDADEVDELFRVIRSLREQGVAILFVSHFLDQVYAISDRITVLRNGSSSASTSPSELARASTSSQKMIGKELDRRSTTSSSAPRAVVVDESDAALFVHADGARPSRRDRSRPTCRSPPARSSASPACSAPAAPSSRACSAAPTAPTPARSTIGGKPTKLAHAAPGDLAPHRVLVREPPRRGHHRRPHRAREHRARAAGRPRLVPPASRRSGRTSSSQSTSRPSTSGPATPTRSCATSRAATSRRCCSRRWLAIAPRLLILDEPTRGIDIGAKAEIQSSSSTSPRTA